MFSGTHDVLKIDRPDGSTSCVTGLTYTCVNVGGESREGKVRPMSETLQHSKIEGMINWLNCNEVEKEERGWHWELFRNSKSTL